MEGWIKLHRSITENQLWNDKPFSRGQAWIDLLLLANHKDGKGISKGKLVEYKTGSVYYSIEDLAARWGWSRHKATDFLNLLEKDDMIRRKSRTNVGTCITIVNWGFFQGQGANEGHIKDNLGTNQGQIKDINKNDKNEKNEKKIYKLSQNQFNTFDSRAYPEGFFDSLERIKTQ